ncbi:uncharacterized protein LOC144701007 [Wolffia australiana]
MAAARGWSLSKAMDGLRKISPRLWPSICCSCCRTVCDLALLVLNRWSGCVARGISSLIGLGIAALFVVLWSFFLRLSSMSCLICALLVLAAACATMWHLGHTSGLLIIGFLGVLTHWFYGNLYVIAGLLIVAGFMFCQRNARILILISSAYSVYSVYLHSGWIGVTMLVNLSFLSNDMLTMFLQECDHARESGQTEEPSVTVPAAEHVPQEDEVESPETEQGEDESTNPPEESEEKTMSIGKHSPVNETIKSDSSSLYEMRRIMQSSSHYEALGFPRYKSIDALVLKREYRKKAVLVHPDKNIGNPMASDSFKRLQSAYEVLSDVTKRRAYDEKLKKDELSIVPHKNHGFSHQAGINNAFDKSRHIKCILCGRIHVWTCTNRSTSRARWCQDCCQYHPAREGEGWVEKGPSRLPSGTGKVETPRAYVCAENKIFEATEWAACQMQGVPCKVNSHQPTFRAKIVTSEPRTPRSDESHASPRRSDHQNRVAMTALVMTATTPEVEKKGDQYRAKQGLSSGKLSDNHHLRKTWTPFKVPRNGLIRQLRRYSLG